MKTLVLNTIITLALGINLVSKAVTWPNRFTTNPEPTAASFVAVVPGAGTNSINNLLNPVVSGPIRLFIMGDSKSVISPSFGISNQWPKIFTNLPYWSSNVVFFTNFAVSGYTFTDISNTYSSVISLLAPPLTGTNNLIIIRDGANDFPTNPNVALWIASYSNLLNDIKGRTNCYSCVWDIQPRTDKPDTIPFPRDSMNQALRRLTNWNYIVKSEKLVPNALLTELFYDGIHTTTNGSSAEAMICDYAIRLGPQHFYDEPKSYWELASLSGNLVTVTNISSFSFNNNYTNPVGYPIGVRVNYQLANAAVSGAVSFHGYANGVDQAVRGFNTTPSNPANAATYGDMMIWVPAFGFYAFTNTSSGAGNTVTLFGGQIIYF